MDVGEKVEKGGSAIITHVPRKTSSSLRSSDEGDVLLRGAILILAGYISVHPTTILSSATGRPGIRWDTPVYASIRRRTMIVDESCEPTRVPYSKRPFSQISTRRVTLSNTWRLMLAVLLTGQRSGAL